MKKTAEFFKLWTWEHSEALTLFFLLDERKSRLVFKNEYEENKNYLRGWLPIALKILFKSLTKGMGVVE